MTTQSEVIRLTKLCQRQRATIRRLEQERAEAACKVAAWKVDAYAAAFASHVNMPTKNRWPPASISFGSPVKHPQQAEPGWTPPPHGPRPGEIHFVEGGIFPPPPTDDACRVDSVVWRRPEAQTWWQRIKSWVTG